MKRTPLYSRSGSARPDPSADPRGTEDRPRGPEGREQDHASAEAAGSGRLRKFVHRHERGVLVGSGAVVALLLMLLVGALRPDGPTLTQRDIDRAVLHTLENQPRPHSLESEAYRMIGPSIVQVRSLAPEDEIDPPDPDGWLDPEQDGPGGSWLDPEEPGVDPAEPESDPERHSTAVGTGVVIVDDGTILTNLHVVAGIERLGVVFADGTESSARIISIRPEMDLAVIQADNLPDDLIPATLASTADLRMGDRVIAVGFPFGIGPSLSSGVVSGLRREYWSLEGDRILSNLIQFDAAANPGNSGGPLVTVDGFVVGIVTAILNPNNQRSFVGIGFAVPIEEAAEAAGRSPF